MTKRNFPVWSLVLLALLIDSPVWAQAPAPAPAQAPNQGDYVIGNEDVLQISVWLHPELERAATVSSRGTITFPPLGEIKASGLTSKQLADRLGDRLSTYLRQTTTVTVTVNQRLSQSLYISGAVARPGRYGFETMPSVLQALQEAGGSQPEADLTRIQIIRKEARGPRVMLANVAAALRSGSEANLPPLRPGDAIVVPVSAVAAGTTSDDAVGVLGAVARPGLYPVSEGQDLWMALAMAGGPTERGKLSNVRVITRGQSASSAVTVNLEETLARGNRRPYLVKPGDIVFVDQKGIGAWAVFTELLGVTRDVFAIIVLTDQLPTR